MKVTKTTIKDLIIIEPAVYGDERGYFTETFSAKTFEKETGKEITFLQDNESFSAKKGTIRGLHLQTNPMAQTKLVRCTQGALLDCVVDLRGDSETFGQHVCVELSEENKKQLLVPRGFAHGFSTLTDNVKINYKVDNYYAKENDVSIKYNDETINIDWQVEAVVVSDKDKNAMTFEEYRLI